MIHKTTVLENPWTLKEESFYYSEIPQQNLLIAVGWDSEDVGKTISQLVCLWCYFDGFSFQLILLTEHRSVYLCSIWLVVAVWFQIGYNGPNTPSWVINEDACSFLLLLTFGQNFNCCRIFGVYLFDATALQLWR